MTAAPKGVSVLASLTSDLMETKKAAARKLTPVAGERGPAVIAPSFPSDLPGSFMSKEGMRDAAKDVRRYAAMLTEVAAGLDTLSGFNTAPSVLADLPDVKEQERAADERAAEPDFNAAFKAKQLEAQASVFPAAVETLGVEAVEQEWEQPDPGWTCPIHKKPGVTKVSAKSQREFIGCPDCNAFAR